MTKKWYNYFVSVDEADSTNSSADAQSSAPASPRSAAQSVAEIAMSVAPEPKFTTPISDPTSFEQIYNAAEIPAVPQGYSSLKVAHMLESEHIRTLPSDVKKSTILVALEGAGIDIKDVIQDAVRRDRALDTYERVQQRAVDELEAKKCKENSELQAQIDKYVTEQRAKIQANNDEVAKEKERFTGWRLKKQQEEKKIADAVGYFVSENPITTGPIETQSSVSKTALKS
jgi:hypothetical protein